MSNNGLVPVENKQSITAVLDEISKAQCDAMSVLDELLGVTVGVLHPGIDAPPTGKLAQLTLHIEMIADQARVIRNRLYELLTRL